MAQVEYAYTPLDLDKCKHTPPKAEDVEYYGEWRCAGFGGVGVHVSAGDQRTYVSFGGRGGKMNWRRSRRSRRSTARARPSNGGSRRSPAARSGRSPTIMRWGTTVTTDTDTPSKGQVLVVTRLGPGGVCHVGYVDGRANPDANELARKIADEHARKFRCGKDRTVTLGKTGPGFSGPYDEELETNPEK